MKEVTTSAETGFQQRNRRIRDATSVGIGRRARRGAQSSILRLEAANQMHLAYLIAARNAEAAEGVVEPSLPPGWSIASIGETVLFSVPASAADGDFELTDIEAFVTGALLIQVSQQIRSGRRGPKSGGRQRVSDQQRTQLNRTTARRPGALARRARAARPSAAHRRFRDGRRVDARHGARAVRSRPAREPPAGRLGARGRRGRTVTGAAVAVPRHVERLSATTSPR